QACWADLRRAPPDARALSPARAGGVGDAARLVPLAGAVRGPLPGAGSTPRPGRPGSGAVADQARVALAPARGAGPGDPSAGHLERPPAPRPGPRLVRARGPRAARRAALAARARGAASGGRARGRLPRRARA